jgi:hypothetical protein
MDVRRNCRFLPKVAYHVNHTKLLVLTIPSLLLAILTVGLRSIWSL